MLKPGRGVASVRPVPSRLAGAAAAVGDRELRRFARERRRALSYQRMLLSLAVLLAMCAYLGADTPCQPARRVERLLTKAAEWTENSCLPESALKRRIGSFQRLLAEFPDDLFVHQRYQDFLASGREPVLEAAKPSYGDLLRRRPATAEYLYLRGRWAFFRSVDEAESLFRQAIDKDRSFAWPYLGLARVALLRSKGSGANETEVISRLEEFAKLCPASLDGYSLAQSIKDDRYRARAARELRSRLAARTDIESLKFYRFLWDLEFSVHPPAEHALVRERIANDIARLRQRPFSGSPSWYALLDEGYKLVGNAGGQRWAEDEVLGRFPASFFAFRVEDSRWFASHGENDQRLYEAAAEWTRRWPECPLAWHLRLLGAARVPGLPGAELAAAADGLLDAVERHPGKFSASPPLELQIAQLYVKRNLRLDRVRPLVDEVLRREEAAAVKSSEPSRGDGREGGNETRLSEVGWLASTILVDLDLKRHDLQRARQDLEAMASALGRDARRVGGSSDDDFNDAMRRADYWSRLGAYAELRGSKAEALVYDQRALEWLSRLPADSGRDDTRADLAARARRLWQALGGAAESWPRLEDDMKPGAFSAAAAATPLQARSRQLPDFELQDFSGRTWRLADLKGKTWLVTVWATWCAPCRAELPLVQKLFAQLRERNDVGVLGFDVDRRLGLVTPYLEQNQITFPNLAAKDYVQGITPDPEIPRLWVVDRDGVIRLENIGFDDSATGNWLSDTLEKLMRISSTRQSRNR